MTLENTIDTLNQTINTIENSFENFKTQQEKKMNQLIAAKNRFEPISLNDRDSTCEKSDFIDFVKKGFNKKSLTSERGSGEYLIPSMIVDEMNRRQNKSSSIRSLASITKITTDVFEMLQEEGDATVGWVAETEDRKETDFKDIKKIMIPTHEVYAKPKVSQKILDDASVNIENWIFESISESMAIFENMAFLKGDGIGKPKGIIPYALDGSIETIKADSKGNLTDVDHLIEMANCLKTEYLDDACWVMSRSFLSSIRRLKEPSSGHYILQPSVLEGMKTTLLGFPVYLNDALDSIQNGVSSVPVLFGNFKKGYKIVERQNMNLLRDPYSSKPFVEFYATKRVGGDVVNKECIKAIHFCG